MLTNGDYKDLKKATDFYQHTLGLKLLGIYDNASMFQIADKSLLILVDEAKGMHSADENKSCVTCCCHMCFLYLHHDNHKTGVSLNLL